jgi:hypothetical protein
MAASPRMIFAPAFPEFPEEPKFGMHALMFAPSHDAHMPNLA